MTPDDKLDTIVTILGQVREWQQVHVAQHEALSEKLGDHHHEIYGNGNPGMKARLQSVEQATARRITPAAQLALGVIEKVIANGVLAIVAFLLYLYATAKPH